MAKLAREFARRSDHSVEHQLKRDPLRETNARRWKARFDNAAHQSIDATNKPRGRLTRCAIIDCDSCHAASQLAA